MLELDNEMNDYKKLNEHRVHDITKIKHNIEEFSTKRSNLKIEIEGIIKDINILTEDFQGFKKEEEILKRLQDAYKETSNNLITL